MGDWISGTKFVLQDWCDQAKLREKMAKKSNRRLLTGSQRRRQKVNKKEEEEEVIN